MKKYLPFIILGLGVVVVAAAVFIFRGKKEQTPVEETAPEIPFDLRPTTSLTPTSDGHWLNMKVENIQIDAASMDYELLYSLPDGRTQGVPGTEKSLKKGATVERKLLLGSESSGKFRYDEGVSQGTLTLKFRDAKGKLVGKLSTDFHLQSMEKEVVDLTTVDDKFKFTPDEVPTKQEWFVTMETFGVPTPLPSSVSQGPYGIFSSDTNKISGKVNLTGDVYELVADKWVGLENGEAENIGIFASVNPQ